MAFPFFLRFPISRAPVGDAKPRLRRPESAWRPITIPIRRSLGQIDTRQKSQFQSKHIFTSRTPYSIRNLCPSTYKHSEIVDLQLTRTAIITSLLRLAVDLAPFSPGIYLFRCCVVIGAARAKGKNKTTKKKRASEERI